MSVLTNAILAKMAVLHQGGWFAVRVAPDTAEIVWAHAELPGQRFTLSEAFGRCLDGNQQRIEADWRLHPRSPDTPGDVFDTLPSEAL